jgi:hypothetical protein
MEKASLLLQLRWVVEARMRPQHIALLLLSSRD